MTFVAALLALLAVACQSAPVPPSTATDAPISIAFDAERAYADLVSQVAFGPRFAGSTTAAGLQDWLQMQLQDAGWRVERHVVPLSDDRQGVNLIAYMDDGPARVLLGAHYDTRPVADEDPDPDRRDDPVPGANDGASGVAVLLELARVLPATAAAGVCLALFDAEDGGNIDGQPWSIGARAFASSGHRCASPEGVVIVDMVGDRDLAIYKDRAVDESLQDAIWNEAETLGVEAFRPQKKYAIIDDHVPFRERGIATAVLIDFDYPWWHTVSDTVDKTSAASLAAVGMVLEQWLRRGGSW